MRAAIQNRSKGRGGRPRLEDADRRVAGRPGEVFDEYERLTVVAGKERIGEEAVARMVDPMHPRRQFER